MILTRETTRIITLSIIGILFATFSAYSFFSRFLPNYKNETANINTVVLATETMQSSHSLQPVISNQWYSSLFFNFPTQPMFALPLAYKVSPAGLSFSYPDIRATRNTIFAPFSEDFTVGFVNAFTKPKIMQVGDWHINALLTDSKNEKLSFTIAHGIPFVTLHSTAPQTQLTIPNDFVITNGTTATVSASQITTDSFLLTTQKHTYIFVFPTKESVSIAKGQLIIHNSPKIFIGLLDKKENADIFKSIADIEIHDTSVTTAIKGANLETTYTIETNGQTPLVALYPHHIDTITTKEKVLGTYATLRGNLQLIKTNSFTTKIPLTTPQDSFTKVADDKGTLTKQITDDIENFIKSPLPSSQDYYLGTWFGKGSSLLLLADTYGLDGEKQKLLNFLEPQFITSLNNFSYNKAKSSIIANKPEFGNENLNDHHFHYGYFIRAAAVLSKFDSTFTSKIQTKTQNLVNDIATIQKDANNFPYLRNFDIYENHSWADGYGNTLDSVNQESTSEAINAWYGIYLWSKVIHDQNLEQTALYLYNSEIIGAKYYWFDTKQMYTNPYTHAIAGIVWGGKIDFATFFSPHTNMTYGIQLLPFTPASMYLGTLGDFAAYSKDYNNNGGDIRKDWGDLFVMWESFYSPTQALKESTQVSNFQTDNAKSLFLYFLLYNSQQKK